MNINIATEINNSLTKEGIILLAHIPDQFSHVITIDAVRYALTEVERTHIMIWSSVLAYNTDL